METRENAGYKIITAIRTGKTDEIVVGYNPEKAFVCWDCSHGDSYCNGGYALSYRKALLIMAERIENRYDYLPVEWKED